MGSTNKPQATLIANLLQHHASVQPHAIALVDGEQVLTYAELCGQVQAFASWLNSVGVEAGDRIVLHVRKCTQEVVATLGALWAQIVSVNVHPQWSLEQLKGVVEDCEPRLLFVDQRKADSLADAAEFEAYWSKLVRVGDPTRASDALRNTLFWPELDAHTKYPPPRADLDALAVLIYTSGSTGRPKGVMHSHRNLTQFGFNVAQYVNATATDRILSLLPLSFGYGLSQLLLSIVSGGTLVLAKVPFPAAVLDAVVQHEITGLAAVPAVWNQLLKVLEDSPRAFPALRYVTNAGGRLYNGDEARLARSFENVPVYTMYGSTEALRSTFLDPQHFTDKPGAIGKAIPNVDIYVVNQHGALCADNEQGELVHAGYHISQGYYRQPELTAARFKPLPAAGISRAYFSGDIVRRDADGVHWFVSREDWMLKVNGFRFSVHEVEAALEGSGLAARAVVLAIEDQEQRLQVHAVVQPAPGKNTESGDLERYGWKHLPSYMQPNVYHIWTDAWPMTATGKLDRVALTKRLKQSAAAVVPP